jgi:hypothetical protein
LAEPDREARQDMQSRTLEALFEVFFRVLKQATGSGLLAGHQGELSSSQTDGPQRAVSRCRPAALSWVSSGQSDRQTAVSHLAL